MGNRGARFALRLLFAGGALRRRRRQPGRAQRRVGGPEPEGVCLRPEDIISRAAEVLRENDMGEWTRASPTLYPHQWSWDTAFIAIGLAHLETGRAAREILTLLQHQWKNGKIPHIVFNPDAPPESYFPGPEHWASAADSLDAPSGPSITSGLCQPPVHAIAARHILRVAEARGDGVAESREFLDLDHIPDPAERPTGYEYDRFIWLVEVIKHARCDDAVLYRTSPFLAKDVLASAILVRANEALLDMAEVVGVPGEERAKIRAWIERGRGGLDERWDPELGLCLDYDLRAGEPLAARTIAGFAQLIAGTGNIDRLEKGLRVLESHAFTGNPDLRRPLPPSASPDDLGFNPRSYWRGPVWPVMNWLLWWSLESSGQRKRAARLRDHALAQLSDGRFGEYYEPFTGEALGSDEQSWTAAVALDWLADGEQPLPTL